MRPRDLLQALFFLLAVRPFFLLFVGLRVRGRQYIPEEDPFILVANHSSHLDAVSLLSLFPLRRLSRIRPVAAADYFERSRLVSYLSRTFFNILPIVRRGSTPETDPRPKMLAALEAGQSLIIFPEGTRGTGEGMAPFRPGVVYLIERFPAAPILPAYLVNMGRSLPKGEFLPVPFFCEVRLGAPIHPQGSREEILRDVERAVSELAKTG